MYRKLLLIITLQILNTASCDESSDYYNILFPSDSPRKGLSFPELAFIDKYRCDTHYVTTCDGYILTIFHIYPNENYTKVHDTPILFMHGLYLSSDDCIIPGPGKANCYKCADNGHHIWAGNNRGNKYGRNHTKLNPDTDPEFWDFSFDQMALCDMPAIINYILADSGQTQINFMGHSQGMTNFILLCAQLEKYNDKVKYAFGMSTATWLEHTRLLALYLQAALAKLFCNPLGEIFAYGGPVQKIASIVCGSTDMSYPACTSLIFALFGYNNFTICQDTIAVAVSCQPSGSSYKNFVRWGQIMNNKFSLFDYGPLKNQCVYGSLCPPIYNLCKYRVATHFISSCNDYVCDPRDLLTLLAHLTGCNNCTHCILSRKYFCHIDYIYSDEVGSAVAPIYLTFYSTGKVICT